MLAPGARLSYCVGMNVEISTEQPALSKEALEFVQKQPLHLTQDEDAAEHGED